MELKPGMIVEYLSENYYELVAENGNNATEWIGKSLKDKKEYWLITTRIKPLWIQIGDTGNKYKTLTTKDVIDFRVIDIHMERTSLRVTYDSSNTQLREYFLEAFNLTFINFE